MSARPGINEPSGRWLLPLSLVGGVLGAQLVTAMPPVWLIYCVATLALLCVLKPAIRWPALALLAGCWTLHQYHLRLDDRLDASLAGQKFELSGTIASIPVTAPGYTRFQFVTDEHARHAGVPARLLVYWYREWPELKPGQRWQLLMKLNPPWARVNFQGSDRERWYFSSGIGGVGTVAAGLPLENTEPALLNVNSMRMALMERIAWQVPDPREAGIVQALATANRSGISHDDRKLMNATGTAHLLAISGLHVGLAAAGGMWVGRFLLWTLPGRFIAGLGVPLVITTGLVFAAFYAMLAGFGTPTVRSVLMLATAMSAMLLSRAIHPLRAWLSSLAVVTLLNPFALTEAGFWFSYLAVAALLLTFSPRTGPQTRIHTAFSAQAAVIVVLLPVSAAVFHSFAPSAFLANLLAIPWVSLFVVPAVLLGIVMSPLSEMASGVLWNMAGEASSILFLFLEQVAVLQGTLKLLIPPGGLQVLLALLGAFLLLLPRGVPHRWLGFFLLAPLFAPGDRNAAPGSLLVEFLDTGQGTSVLLRSGDNSMIYDTGPGDGQGFDQVSSVIEPAVAAAGAGPPGQVVISHADLDHSGGLASLQARYPVAAVYGNFPVARDAVKPCVAPRQWEWPGVQFEVLHPSPGLPYQGNDSSCVISVRTRAHRVLLAGDISKQVENRLVLDNLARHSVLLVPHHGSKSSSSNVFIRQADPDLAVATASLGNRFDFPRPETRQRYEFRGSRFLSTSDCGAIRLRLRADGGIAATSARKARNRIWRWPAARNCP